ncbi:MAG: glycine cleavage system protein GcvH [Propionicimonas sp.]
MFPDDLHYSAKHEWVRVGSGPTARVGITDYAAEQLGDVVYVSLPQVGEEVALDDACAEVESTKSVSDVFAPVSGVVSAVNELLLESPEIINEDPYGDGWIFEVELADQEELDELMDADEYSASVSG